MIHTYKSASGKTTISVTHRNSDKVVYIILPSPLLESELEDIANEKGCSIAVLSGLDWNDDLTPWPASAITVETGAFTGEAQAFNDYLTGDVIHRVENILGVHNPVRSLIGLSLSGLFAVWQWAQDDYFTNIASISGSFWYDGFVDWVKDTYTSQNPKSHKTGKAFFSIGSQEGKSGPKVFAGVREATQEVVEILRKANIHAELTVTQGSHHSPLLPRLRQALAAV